MKKILIEILSVKPHHWIRFEHNPDLTRYLNQNLAHPDLYMFTVRVCSTGHSNGTLGSTGIGSHTNQLSQTFPNCRPSNTPRY